MSGYPKEDRLIACAAFSGAYRKVWGLPAPRDLQTPDPIDPEAARRTGSDDESVF